MPFNGRDVSKVLQLLHSHVGVAMLLAGGGGLKKGGKTVRKVEEWKEG